LLCKAYLRTEDDEEKDGIEMSERFKAMSPKYMCTWMPEEALSICTNKVSGNESNNAIDCLLCISRTLITTADILWGAVKLPPNNVETIRYLENLRIEYEHQKIAFLVMSEKFKPGYLKAEQETWADTVETLITKFKEVKASE